MISIHAPARGATIQDDQKVYDDDDFNPRSREGSDLTAIRKFGYPQISIHAPARGATYL